MPDVPVRAEAEAFLAAWTSSILNRDVEAARALRTDDYRFISSDGSVLSVADELDALAAPSFTIQALETRLRGVDATADGAALRFDMSFRGDWGGGQTHDNYRADLAIVRRDGRWQAASLALHDRYSEARRERRSPGAVLRGVGRRLKRALPERRSAGFQETAYAPYRPSQDYWLERSTPNEAVYEEAALPVPPPELWLGYNYPAHGRLHVDAMLDSVSAAGLDFQPGDRILDLGCGAKLRDLGGRHQRRAYPVVPAQSQPAFPLPHQHQSAASAVRRRELPLHQWRLAVHSYRRHGAGVAA